MKLQFLLTVVLGLLLNSPPLATRRRRVPPLCRQVRRRLQRLRFRQLPPVLVALFAASTLQWTTRKRSDLLWIRRIHQLLDAHGIPRWRIP